jgi:hypothetical protein
MRNLVTMTNLEITFTTRVNLNLNKSLPCCQLKNHVKKVELED